MGIWYATRESVMAAHDIKATAADTARIDDAIEQGSRAVEALCHRTFYPEYTTHYFDWPNRSGAPSWRLWLDEHELISLASIVVGGVALDPDDFLLEPVNDGPPFGRLETDLSGPASFGVSVYSQRAVALTGVFGYQSRDLLSCVLATGINASVSTVDVTAPRLLGVGSLLLVGDERMIVTERTLLDSGQNLATPITASTADVAVAVSDGTKFVAGELITLDAETMEITAIAGNSLVVRRARDATVLAAHTGSDVYTRRRLTVQRAALGTEAEAHSGGDTVSVFGYPSLVAAVARGEALDMLLGESSGYARQLKTPGEASTETPGRGLPALRERCRATHGRQARHEAV